MSGRCGLVNPPMRGVLVIVCVLLGSAVADAQGGAEQARIHYQAGATHFAAGRYVEAIREFEQSYAASRKADILYNLAVCHDKLGRRERVIAYLKQYLAEKPDAEDRQQVATWLSHLERAQAEESARVETPATQQAPDQPPKPVRRRLGGWVTLGTGVALTAVGLGLGGAARAKWNEAQGSCDADNACDLRGHQLAEDARLRGNLSTAFVAAGLVTATVGVVLVIIARARPERATAASLRVTGGMSRDSFGLTLAGGF